MKSNGNTCVAGVKPQRKNSGNPLPDSNRKVTVSQEEKEIAFQCLRFIAMDQGTHERHEQSQLLLSLLTAWVQQNAEKEIQ